MRNELTKRIFLACITVFLMTFSLILYVMNTYLMQRNVAELHDRAILLSSAVNEYGWEFLCSVQSGTARITLIDYDGTVLFDSKLNPDKMENHSQREEFQEAIQYGEGESERYSDSILKKTVNYAVRLDNYQVIRVSMNQDTVFRLVVSMLSPVILIVLLMILLSVVLASESSKKIMKPINQLDPENPDDRNIYDEMKPFIRRLIAQNQQIQHQIQQLQEEHKKQDAIRREFTANVSHELKTPLTSISGFAEILRDGYVQEKDVSHFADNIYKEAQRLMTLVNDILKLSRLEDGVTEMYEDRTSINLLALSKSVCERLSLSAQKNNISLSCQGEAVHIIGMPHILEEIIYNICDNAIKYNHSGGFVRVTLYRSDNLAILRIEDNGIGIPEADQERIFERFYRVNKSHSKEVGGTGLGLSIVKHGMALHYARIELDSEEGKGTCIRLCFPL
ncbi:MAG: two-component sensor histidine kinase [Oscillospiraceae bacterium]|nr:two-component sensor histidine kinase [Oscillospiraceae bacterium]